MGVLPVIVPASTSPIAGSLYVSQIPDSTMIIDHRARLDDEIVQLVLALSSRRTQRNALAPISRFPPEILASIFFQCACISHEENPHSRVPDWIKVSQVCRRWRDIALNCSVIWSFVSSSSPKWVEELLIRARKSPLKVRLSYDPRGRSDSIWENMALQTDRIQDLCVSVPSARDSRAIRLFSLPAPHLQSLRIAVNTFMRRIEPTPASGPVFDGDTPALRKLELVNYIIPLASPTLRGLTFLRLRSFRAPSQPTLAELKVALSQMQDLECLRLEDAFPSAHGNLIDQSLEDTTRLSLPRLSRLSIIADFSAVVHFLSCLDHPAQTEVRLRCWLHRNENYTLIYPLLAKQFITSDLGFAPVPVIRTCFISETVSRAVAFIFSTAERDSGRHGFSDAGTPYDLGNLHEDWDCNIPLKLDIVPLTPSSMDYEYLIAGVCGSVALTRVQTVHASFFGRILSPAFWMNTFGHLNELRCMNLCRVGLRGLITALSLRPHYHPNKGDNPQVHSSQVFARALEEITFHGVEFSKSRRRRSWGGPDDGSCSPECLRDALSSRRAEGHVLLRLALKRCPCLRGEDVAGLKESVPHVDWDRIVNVNGSNVGEESNFDPTDDDEDDEDVDGDQGHIVQYDSFV